MTDQLTTAHERITEAVERLVTGAEWQTMLDVAARFHTYSPNNIWLILAQRPDATRVAGYRTWRNLDRWVRKGEHRPNHLPHQARRRRARPPRARQSPTGIQSRARLRVRERTPMAATWRSNCPPSKTLHGKSSTNGVRLPKLCSPLTAAEGNCPPNSPTLRIHASTKQATPTGST